MPSSHCATCGLLKMLCDGHEFVDPEQCSECSETVEAASLNRCSFCWKEVCDYCLDVHWLEYEHVTYSGSDD